MYSGDAMREVILYEEVKKRILVDEYVNRFLAWLYSWCAKRFISSVMENLTRKKKPFDVMESIIMVGEG